MGFSWQEYGRGLPFLSLEYLPGLGIESDSPTLQEASSPVSHLGSQWKGLVDVNNSQVPGWQDRAE